MKTDKIIDAYNAGKKFESDKIAKVIHYPECWDVGVYPTLLDAVKESFKYCHVCEVKE